MQDTSLCRRAASAGIFVVALLAGCATPPAKAPAPVPVAPQAPSCQAASAQDTPWAAG